MSRVLLLGVFAGSVLLLWPESTCGQQYVVITVESPSGTVRVQMPHDTPETGELPDIPDVGKYVASGALVTLLVNDQEVCSVTGVTVELFTADTPVDTQITLYSTDFEIFLIANGFTWKNLSSLDAKDLSTFFGQDIDLGQFNGDEIVDVKDCDGTTYTDIGINRLTITGPPIDNLVCIVDPPVTDPPPTNLIGSEHEMTVSTEPPTAGASVGWTVTAGPHMGTGGSAVTDSAGEAQFSYTGDAAGCDTIEVTVDGIAICTSKKEWVQRILINEVDAHTPGPVEDREFVELFRVKEAGEETPTPLGRYVLLFFDGATDTSYAAFDLDGFNTDAKGFFVLGNPTLNDGGVDVVDLEIGDNTIRNGQHAVVLYLGRAADFPNGTPVTELLQKQHLGRSRLHHRRRVRWGRRAPERVDATGSAGPTRTREAGAPRTPCSAAPRVLPGSLAARTPTWRVSRVPRRTTSAGWREPLARRAERCQQIPPSAASRLDVPPGALSGDLDFFLEDGGGDFGLVTDQGAGMAVASAFVGPDGTSFTSPVSVILCWRDADSDGNLDGSGAAETDLAFTKDGAVVAGPCGTDPNCDQDGNCWKVEVMTLSEFNLVLLDPTVGGLQLPGDCNKDGAVDLSDAVCTLSVLFTGGLFPCGDGSSQAPGNIALIDWQPDEAVDLSDAVAMLQFLFFNDDAHPLAVPGAERSQCVAIPGCESNVECP